MGLNRVAGQHVFHFPFQIDPSLFILRHRLLIRKGIPPYGVPYFEVFARKNRQTARAEVGDERSPAHLTWIIFYHVFREKNNILTSEHETEMTCRYGHFLQ